MKQIKNVNVDSKVWNRIPVKNKSKFVEFAVLQAIDGLGLNDSHILKT